jgi:hypothetical protein
MRIGPFLNFLDLKKGPLNFRATGLAQICALGGTRTPNLLIRSQMLYPLSYKRIFIYQFSQQFTGFLIWFSCLQDAFDAGVYRYREPLGRVLELEDLHQLVGYYWED